MKRASLHYAAQFNSVDIVKLLIKKGANINAKDINDQIIINKF